MKLWSQERLQMECETQVGRQRVFALETDECKASFRGNV